MAFENLTQSRMSFVLEAYGASNVGKVRTVNQDAFLCLPEERTFIVADGMGGHAGGEIASMLCILAVQTVLQSDPTLSNVDSRRHPSQQDVMRALSNAVNHASARIYDRAADNSSLKGMGTTVTLLKVIDDRGFFAHVGDSRLYLMRGGVLQQLTTDHSWVNDQIRAGVMSGEEAAAHPYRNVITRSVGFKAAVEVETGCVRLQENDCLLLCSDGLHGKLKDPEIARLLTDGETYAVRLLIDLANDRGGDDNITAIVVRVVRADS